MRTLYKMGEIAQKIRLVLHNVRKPFLDVNHNKNAIFDLQHNNFWLGKI